jgi:aminoglycoside phosphotransferase family enzyme/predicted kinase
MKVAQTEQDDAIAFLKAHDLTGSSTADDVIQTHGALVFLHQTDALKIKRAVKYDYLDFSTLPLRKKMLERELELNSAAAPGLYHDVIALRRKPDGTVGFGGTGATVEWVLRMTRFPAEAELSSLADRGLIDDPLADNLGQSIAAYHCKAKRRTEDGSVLIREIIEELGREMGGMHDRLGAETVQEFLTASANELAQIDHKLQDRSQAGWVRRCHGDLHLRNIVMWKDVPTLFDALEFDERLGTCDVLYDLAFLLMDLSHQDLDAAANLVLNAYLFHSDTADHYAGLSALPLFLAVRAGIRAMVDVQTAAVQNDPADLIAEARVFLGQALSFLKPAPPQLIAIGGLSGSGKTTVARQVAPYVGAFPGAIHLRSDLERKAYFNVPPYEKLPAEAYQPQVSDTVYQIMRAKAQLSLAAGQTVIMDAVHATPIERAMAAQIAHDTGCAFQGIWLDADTSLRVQRVTHRGPDASDADAQVALGQDTLPIGDISWQRLDAAQSPTALAAKIRRMQSQLGAD